MSGSHGGWKTRVGDRLPPRIAIPLRARLGPARELEMRLVREFVPRGGLCVDVGANKGTWTEVLRRAVGPHGTVVVIEPQPDLAQYLRTGFAWTDSIEIHECALSNQPGRLELSIPLEGGRPIRGHATLGSVTGASDVCVVGVQTLDEVLGGRSPAFVKIDVEGHELGVVEGMEQVMSHARPAMVVEMMDKDPRGTTAQCFKMLSEKFGYEAAYLHGGKLTSIPEWPGPALRVSPNVVFVHKESSTSR